MFLFCFYKNVGNFSQVNKSNEFFSVESEIYRWKLILDVFRNFPGILKKRME